MTTKEHKEFMKQFRFKPCYVCGSTYQSTGHHLIPVKRGGQDTLDNIRVLCFNCHQIIDNGTLSQWIREGNTREMYYDLRKDLKNNG